MEVYDVRCETMGKAAAFPFFMPNHRNFVIEMAFYNFSASFDFGLKWCGFTMIVIEMCKINGNIDEIVLYFSKKTYGTGRNPRTKK